MNVLLTDHLTCARCGPDFGLILLAQDVQERRVLSGEFGCPNCRDRFPVTAGFADLRPPPRPTLPAADPGAAGVDAALDPLRLAACLAVPEGPGFFAFVGSVGASASRVASLVPGIEVVVVEPAALGWPEEAGVSRMAAGPGLPFRGGAQGVAVDLNDWVQWASEAMRVVAVGRRVVLTGVDPEGIDPPRLPGFTLILHEAGFMVFSKNRGVLSGIENPVA